MAALAIASPAASTATAAPRRMYSAYAAAIPGEPSRVIVNNGKESYSYDWLPDPLIQAHRRLTKDKLRFGVWVGDRQRTMFYHWLLSAVIALTGLVGVTLITALFMR